MLGLPVRIPRGGANHSGGGNNFWLLNCCVSPPQSEIGRVRIDRTQIGAPSDFRHIGHVGANDNISTTEDGNALGALLRSKGGLEHAMRDVPDELRAHDVPIREKGRGEDGGQRAQQRQ